MARVFTYNGMELPDPDPKMKPDQVREIFAVTYPDLATAKIEGPTKKGDNEVYKFTRAVGAKG
jgi:PRTRC genetic system protein C